jgi:hypothetical protein
MITNTLMEKFIPETTRHMVKQTLEKCNIFPGETENRSTDKFLYKAQEGSKDLHLVPKVEFYDIPQHLSILHRMFQEFSMGEHLLLVGPQAY